MSAWNAPPPTYDAHSSSLTPYLQLSHLLSLTWLAYPILSIAFIAFRLQLSLASAQGDVASAKNDLLASCKAAETAATSAASMPRYLAIASNQQIVDAVNGTLNGAREALVLTLTAMEAIINFIVDLYRSTFLCFLELVVRGGLSLLISAVDELNSLIQSAASGISNSIQSDISSANSIIQSAVNAINKVNPFGNISAPQISQPDLSSLSNITLPDSFTQALTNLNNSIPTVAQLKDEVDSIIDTPFELLKADINNTFLGISFNSSVLPVPQLNTLTFCDDMDLSIVDDVGQDLIKTARIGIVILILLALLLIGLNCLLEWYKWRCMKRHLEFTRQAWLSDPTMIHAKIPSSSAPTVTLTDHNLMMLHVESSHPLLTRIANNLSRILRLSPSQHSNLRWFFHYVFHPPALACLLIGLLGILSIELQLLAMHPLIAKYQEQSANVASDFSDTIFTAVNASMYNQSATYANDINSQIDVIQTTINDGVFGWVNTTTTSINTTIANFYSDVQNAVTTLFGGTFLESPAEDFIQCFLGSKVDAIEDVLTFLQDNLVINVPRVNDSVLVLSQASINEATQPIATAALGGGNGDNEGLLLDIINSYAESLKKERIMFGIFIALWGFVVLMALCIIFWHSHGKRLVEMRKRRRFEREHRAGIDNIIVPFRLDCSPKEKLTSNAHLDLPSFTPLPSPRGSTYKPSHKPNSSSGDSNSDLLANLSPSTDSDAERGTANPNTTWADTFRQKFVAPPANKLKAMRRSRGRQEVSIPDQPFAASDSSISGNIAKESKGVGKRPGPGAWFGRVAAVLDKKHHAYGNVNVDAPYPAPRISITSPTVSDDLDNDAEPNASARTSAMASADADASEGLNLSSRWSVSPTQPRHHISPPWKSLIKKSLPAETHVQTRDTLTGIDSSSNNEMQMSMAPMAPPIHLGFDNSRYPKLESPTRTSFAPIPSRTGAQAGMTPLPMKPSAPLLVPPKREPFAPSPPDDNTPIMRLLTSASATRHASSSAANPFVTPFDDEYRVVVAQPVHTRKSIPTNPFLG
ncbi:hypothetical protein H0H92_004749 [Tricholoma furcatifolium]|nr:hypothetical protein H0H92_006312 [Tricholoma furcatifolium]KAG6825087.1 hypothetical protein H0H92_004749 [Tricholoma furcatifolium]